MRPATLLEIARRNDYPLPADDEAGARRALRLPRLRALHRGLDPDHERAADGRGLPPGRRRLRGRGRLARRGLPRGDLLAERARAARGRLGRDLQRLLRRRPGGARAARRRGAADARHRPRLPARRGASRSCATRPPTASAGSSASASAGSRPSSRPSRTSRPSRSRVSWGSRRSRTPARSRGRRRCAARWRSSAPTGSGTGSARPRTRACCGRSPTAGSCSTSARSRTCARGWSARSTEHPLPQLLAAGARCSISTDDPAMFGTDLGARLRSGRRARARPARRLRGRARGRALRRGDEGPPARGRRCLRVAGTLGRLWPEEPHRRSASSAPSPIRSARKARRAGRNSSSSRACAGTRR